MLAAAPALRLPSRMTLAAPLASKPPLPRVSVSVGEFIVTVETALIRNELIVTVTPETLAAMVMLSVAVPAVRTLAEYVPNGVVPKRLANAPTPTASVAGWMTER